MKYSKSYILFTALGILLSVVPALSATLAYFPLWTQRGSGYVVSGITLTLVIISAVPLLRIVAARLKSPSAPVLWLIIFLFFLTMSKIADELTVISFFGFVGNLLGSLCFRLAKSKGGEVEK